MGTDHSEVGSRRLAMAMLAVAIVGLLAALSGIDARATYGARVSSDEPQYLLTAISIGEDFSLDISDELQDRRFLPFHEINLNTQTIDLNDSGRRVSPHDPLLPALLAGPMRVGGWPAAKATLAVFAAAVAALTLRLAVTRLSAPLVPAALIVAGFTAAPPFSAYGSQVYPAIVAALLVVIGALAVIDPPPAVGVTSGPMQDRPWAPWQAVAVVIGLPWLSVKYVPVAAVIAVVGLWRWWRRRHKVPIALLTVYAAAGVFYLVSHQVVYGGWTVYAAGDHFVDGEWMVIGNNPDYVGRTRRLIGLIVDRGFGLAAWNPAYLAALPAVAWLWRSQRSGRFILIAMLAAGWIVATWLALTMHGWWWPGRQVVPILPLVVAVIAAAVGRSRPMTTAVLGACVIGSATWLRLAWEASNDRKTLIVDFQETVNPWYRLWRQLLPDHISMGPIDMALTAIWLVILGAGSLYVARRPATRVERRPDGHSIAGKDSEPSTTAAPEAPIPESTST